MRQADIDRAVARATGESVDTIKRLGFSLVMPPRLGRQGQNGSQHQRRHGPKHAATPPKTVSA